MTALPDNICKRVLTAEEAAEYCGCRTVRLFMGRVRRGLYTEPIGGDPRNGWDRKALDQRLDYMSGLSGASEQDDKALWLEAINSAG